MGSPYETFTTSRVHAVTTPRGAAAILQKILLSTGEVIYSPKWARDVNDVMENLLVQPALIKRWVDDQDWWETGMMEIIPWNAKQLAIDFLLAYVRSIDTQNSVTLTCTARYAWRDYEKYECIVFFRMRVLKWSPK